jgi:hypothetical protein
VISYPKGGSGKSTISLAMALLLAIHLPAEVSDSCRYCAAAFEMELVVGTCPLCEVDTFLNNCRRFAAAFGFELVLCTCLLFKLDLFL